MGVVVLTVGLDLISYHYALGYWMLVSAILLPILYWKDWRFKTAMGIAMLLAVGVTLSPIDFRIKSGPPGFRILPTSHGVATPYGTVGYGCTVRNPPPKALVLSF